MAGVNHLKGAGPACRRSLMHYESPRYDAAAMSRAAAYGRPCWGALEMLKNGVTSVQDDAFIRFARAVAGDHRRGD